VRQADRHRARAREGGWEERSAMAKKRVVLTGACGYVAQRMIEPLRERYDLVCLDVVDKTRDGTEVPDVQIADLSDRDRDRYRAHFRGADAILHCAFVQAPGLGADAWQDNSEPKFWAEYANVGMAYNVYRTAQEEGVKRVVVASSNHAAFRTPAVTGRLPRARSAGVGQASGEENRGPGWTRWCRRLWGFDGRLRSASVWRARRGRVAARRSGQSIDLGAGFGVVPPRSARVAWRHDGFCACAVVAGREPAIWAVDFVEMDLWDRRHGLAIPVASVGGARGSLPRSKVSMTIMRPPQQGHG